jgi:four helix bundle protein
MFGFQKLDVYRCAIEFVSLAVPLSEATPKGFAALGDQLRRASTSIPLNVAEGSGKFDKDARRFYAIARGSALECAAIVDVLSALALIQPELRDRLQTLLDRIVAMLTKLIRD